MTEGSNDSAISPEDGSAADEVSPTENPRATIALILTAVENDRRERAKIIEDARLIRATTLRAQLLFLYFLLVVAFVVLAVRTEINSNENRANTHAIQQGLYETCKGTAARTEGINPGRVALIELLTNLLNSDETLDVQEKEAAVTVLQEGLVLPVVQCGDAP